MGGEIKHDRILMTFNINPQVLAADPDQSVWVSANAGTGKTRVLIDRLTRLLLIGTRPERILCLTFTKAAAAEMANRLNDRLSDWAALEPEALNLKLHSLLDRSPTSEEKIRAQQLFTEIIDTPEGLKIRTIHAFCESLLARFSLEANVAPNFQVIDERRAAELRLETRDALFQRSLNHDSQNLAQALGHIAGIIDEVGFAEMMAELDAARGRLSKLILSHGSLNALIDASRKTLGLDANSNYDSIIEKAVDDSAIDLIALQAACKTLASGSKNERDRAVRINAWLQEDIPTRKNQFLEHYLSIFLTKKRAPRATRGLISKKLAVAAPHSLSALTIEQERVYALSESLKAFRVFENTAAILAIGYALLEAYESLKKFRGFLDYDDLIAKAANLLSEKAGVSWVHYKLDGGIDHILVDEAQDTSPTQWQVIAQLAGDFFSGLGRSNLKGQSINRTIFAVGDEKQSIYSFQGADPTQFSITGEQFSRRIVAAKQKWLPIEIAKSWRSTPAILNAVDHVFGASDASDGLTWKNRQIYHQPVRQGDAGRVELWPMIKASEPDDLDPWDAPLDQIPGDDPRILLAENIATTVKNWLATGENLESRSRPITAGDIMILVRTRGIFADEMVRALKNLKVPVAGSDRMILTEYLAVMDLIVLGRFALFPDDDLNTATLLKGPFVGLDETQLFKLAHKRKGSLWQELSRLGINDPIYQPVLKKLRQVLSTADFLPPFEFFNLELTKGGRRALLARLGSEATDPVDEFMALALDFERDHIPSLEGFLHWIETGQPEVKRNLEQAAGAVRIMTVHGAKGLQAPIVFIADNGQLPARQLQDKLRWANTEDNKGTVLWPALRDNDVALTEVVVESQRLEMEREYRRLLYVAMTRAEDRLYVTGWQGRREPDEACWHALVEAGLRRANNAVEVNMETGIGLRLDSPQLSEPIRKKPKIAVKSESAPAPPWTKHRGPEEPALLRSLSPSRMGKDPIVNSPISSGGYQFKRGKIIHTLLKSLPELPANARPSALAHYLRHSAQNLSAAAQSEITTEVLTVLNHPEFSPLFGPDSQAEVPIVGRVGTCDNFVISGQIDRILITKNTVTIIDFKTNRSPPKLETDIAIVYLRQMAAYRALLRLIYPNHEIVTSLLWTDGPKLLRLSNRILDVYAP